MKARWENKFPAMQNYRSKEAAEIYDEIRLRGWRGRLLDKLEREAVARVARMFPQEFRVFDLPCGTGRTTVPLVEKFQGVVGGDISKEMLRVAEHRFENSHHVSFLCASAMNLPFSDNVFDCVFSVRFFGHTPPSIRIQILREMSRVSQKYVALMFYVRDPFVTIRKHLQHRIRPPRGPWYPLQGMKEVRKLFLNAGLEINSVKHLMPGVMESRFIVGIQI